MRARAAPARLAPFPAGENHHAPLRPQGRRPRHPLGRRPRGARRDPRLPDAMAMTQLEAAESLKDTTRERFALLERATVLVTGCAAPSPACPHSAHIDA